MTTDNLDNQYYLLKKYLTSEEQKKIVEYILRRSTELLKVGFSTRITIGFQNHRINDLQELNFIAGLSQSSYYLEKID